MEMPQSICEKHDTFESELWCFYVQNIVNNEYETNNSYFLCKICIDGIFLKLNVPSNIKDNHRGYDWDRTCTKCLEKNNNENSIWIYTFQIFYSSNLVDRGSIYSYYLCDNCNDDIYDKVFEN